MVTKDSSIRYSPEEGYKEALRRIERAGEFSRELWLLQLDLTDLPEQLFELTDIEHLDLSFNRLSDLPSNIRRLKRLKRLNLYNNRLGKFPVSVKSLQSLEELNLGKNNIGYLPPDIGKLSRLKKLNLPSNNIRRLPPQLRNLGALEDLHLIDNPIVRLNIWDPEGQISLSMDTIAQNFHAQKLMDVYFQQHDQPIVFLSYARLDTELVEELREILQEEGYRAWMDVHDIVGGEDWERAISGAIENCDIFVAILSKNSVSRRGMVQKELKIALKKYDEMLPGDIYIVPVRLDDSYIPEKLSHLQIIDWNGGEGRKRLLEAVEASLERRMD